MSITLTEKASSELKTLIQKEIDDQHMNADAVLRVGVVGGGCSGFMYKMGFDTNVAEEDHVEEIDGVRVVVDSKSYLYLNGTVIDFQDGLMGRGFVFSNPNAQHTCGCNQSFSA